MKNINQFQYEISIPESQNSIEYSCVIHILEKF